MSAYPMYAPERAAYPRSGYEGEPTGYFKTTLAIGDSSFHTPIFRLQKVSLNRRPPPGWDQWEKNVNWPFPANHPKIPSRRPAPKPAPQEEVDVNSNWPFSAPAASRKGTTSQSSRAPPPLMEFVENIEPKANNDLPLPISIPKKSVKPVIPSQPSQLQTEPFSNSPFLLKGSPSLIRFDLRLPYMCARKLVRGAHWTHLNHDDLRQPACTPTRTRMRIYIHACPEWIVKARTSSRDFVTVGDVLEAVHGTFNHAIDDQQWACDSINPEHSGRVTRAFQRRLVKLESTKLVRLEDARRNGLFRVDYLGSQCHFSGLTLAYGGDNSEWWMMDVSSEPKK
ncbi:hypothetical protein EW145_g1853 [Phellinidium pouzarii]|uniref:DUF6699 domain-containing protein n=1 Tax=Phellinidium pouzarii TaxID=167371 RepID=A0A4S4LDF3_9AGAM|nr:hypothetical protein EW145_g1853 [Phellinidium pouzarii]